MALASAVNGGAPPKAKADVGALLEKSKLNRLPFQLQPEQDVFQVSVDGQQGALADTPPRIARNPSPQPHRRRPYIVTFLCLTPLLFLVRPVLFGLRRSFVSKDIPLSLLPLVGR